MTVSPESQFFLFSIVLLWTKLKSRALFGAVKEHYLSSQVQDACSAKGWCAVKGADGLQICSLATYTQCLQAGLGLVFCPFDGFTVK